jgi:hypothetical protein
MSNQVDSSNLMSIDKFFIEKETINVYLDQEIDTSLFHFDNEIARRVKIGWKSFNKYHYNQTVSISFKRKRFNRFVLPVLTYGCETLTVTRESEALLRSAVRDMERIITQADKHKESSQEKRSVFVDISEFVKFKKWQWAGQIARSNASSWPKVLLAWTPEKKSGSSHREISIKWVDEITAFGGENWMARAQDRNQWIDLGRSFAEMSSLAAK